MEQLTENALRVLRRRYLKKDTDGKVIETPQELFQRVAQYVANADCLYGGPGNHETRDRFYSMMANLEFLPNSPTLMNADRPLGQLSACFVLPVKDSIDSIFDAVKNAAIIHKSGGGTGFSFSNLRPENSVVFSTHGVASGPVSFMEVFDAATEAIKQGGTRRGANMGILRIDHPDIEKFITCKNDTTRLNNFNISVAITDRFMKCLHAGEAFGLVDPRNPHKVVTWVDPEHLFNLIVDSAWATGEPGIIFIDEINRHNPVSHLMDIEATNPCVTGDTMVATPTGFRPAKDIQIGDKINTVKGVGIVAKREVHEKMPVFRVDCSDGGYIRVTASHQFYAAKRGVCTIKNQSNSLFTPIRLDQLEPGDSIQLKPTKSPFGILHPQLNRVIINNITPDGFDTVYDLYEPTTDTWITNGYVSRGCGEQPLLPYESCNLGSINLGKFVRGGQIDYDHLSHVVKDAVHFLDNVITMNRYPLPIIGDRTKLTRKIGLGVMGWADMLIKLGMPYESDSAIHLAEKVMGFIKEKAITKSIELGAERGSFPAFKGSLWDNNGLKHMRNATVTTIAPTGTLSIIANCSSGIEPLFAVSYVRRALDGKEMVCLNPEFEWIAKTRGFWSEDLAQKIGERGDVQDIGNVPQDIKELFKTAHHITPLQHLRMQAAFQVHTHNAVSKTINLPADATREDVKEVFLEAHELGLKGITVYRDMCRPYQVLNCQGTLRAVPAPRPKQTKGITECVKTGCGKLYVTVNHDDKGICEVFAQMGKSGGCVASQIETIGRLISTALRSGVGVEPIIKQLSGIRCPNPIWNNGDMILSCSDGIARVLKEVTGIEAVDADENIGVPICPDCGHTLISQGGCLTCNHCGYSKCS